MFTTFCLNTLICGKNSDIAPTSRWNRSRCETRCLLEFMETVKDKLETASFHNGKVQVLCARVLHNMFMYVLFSLLANAKTHQNRVKGTEINETQTWMLYILVALPQCSEIWIADLSKKSGDLIDFSVISRVVATISCWETLAGSNIVQRSWPAHCVWTVWMLAVKGWWATPCVQRAVA